MLLGYLVYFAHDANGLAQAQRATNCAPRLRGRRRQAAHRSHASDGGPLYVPVEQPARSPLLLDFWSGWLAFLLVTLHAYVPKLTARIVREAPFAGGGPWVEQSSIRAAHRPNLGAVTAGSYVLGYYRE